MNLAYYDNKNITDLIREVKLRKKKGPERTFKVYLFPVKTRKLFINPDSGERKERCD